MLRYISFLIFIVVLSGSCSNNNSKDFEQYENGLRYLVLEESVSKDSINVGDFIELELKYYNEKDSLLFNSNEFGSIFRMQVQQPSHKGGCFENALLKMKPGARYQFLILADSFYLQTKREKLPKGVKSKSDLLFDIHIIRKISAKEIKQERELLEKKMEEQEQSLIQQYLFDNKIEAKPKESGLYLIKKVRGNGQNPEKGDFLTVHYTGKLIDGKLFDSSYKRKAPFTFQLGIDKVIEGWEEGFSYVKKGAKAMFIVPSKLAYKEEGYPGVIPPYSPLVFEVELLHISKEEK